MAHTSNKIPIRFIGAATGNARCYHIPRQSDTVTLDGTDYTVCDVIHNFPSARIDVELGPVVVPFPCTIKRQCELLEEILIEVKADIL